MGKALAIGCGIIVLIIGIGIGAAVWYGPKLMEMGKAMIAAEEERQSLAKNWAPPAEDATPADVFPQQLAGYQRERTDESKLAALEIDVVGDHAIYRNGSSQVEAYLFPVTKLESEALFGRIEKLKSGSGMSQWEKIDLGSDYSRVYLSKTGLGQNHLWFSKGRLIVFRTDDEEDREALIKDFFRAHAAPASAPPPPQ